MPLIKCIGEFHFVWTNSCLWFFASFGVSYKKGFPIWFHLLWRNVILGKCWRVVTGRNCTFYCTVWHWIGNANECGTRPCSSNAGNNVEIVRGFSIVVVVVDQSSWPTLSTVYSMIMIVKWWTADVSVPYLRTCATRVLIINVYYSNNA